MILAAKSLALNPKDPPTWQALANHSKSVSDSIKKLVSSIRDKAPGQKECEDVIEKLSVCVRSLDQASLSAISQNLSPRREKSAQAYAEQTSNCAMEIVDKIDIIRNAAKGEAEKLGHAVKIRIVHSHWSPSSVSLPSFNQAPLRAVREPTKEKIINDVSISLSTTK